MLRGEIRWYTFKAPDKKRPVLILTRNSILDYLGEVTVAPHHFNDPGHSQRGIAFNRGRHETGLRRQSGSYPNGGQSQAGHRLTQLPPSKMQQVGQAIQFALGL